MSNAIITSTELTDEQKQFVAFEVAKHLEQLIAQGGEFTLYDLTLEFRRNHPDFYLAHNPAKEVSVYFTTALVNNDLLGMYHGQRAGQRCRVYYSLVANAKVSQLLIAAV